MTTTIISTVDNVKAGTALIAELVEAGLKGSDAEVLDGNHETIMSVIVDRGFDESDARDYLEAVEGGKSLVAARAADDQIEGFLANMERYEVSGSQACEAAGTDGNAVLSRTTSKPCWGWARSSLGCCSTIRRRRDAT